MTEMAGALAKPFHYYCYIRVARLDGCVAKKCNTCDHQTDKDVPSIKVLVYIHLVEKNLCHSKQGNISFVIKVNKYQGILVIAYCICFFHCFFHNNSNLLRSLLSDGRYITEVAFFQDLLTPMKNYLLLT